MLARNITAARFVAPDGDNVLTLWHDNGSSPFGPEAIARVTHTHGDVWLAVVEAYGEPVCGEMRASANGGHYVCRVPLSAATLTSPGHDTCEGVDAYGDCMDWESDWATMF